MSYLKPTTHQKLKKLVNHQNTALRKESKKFILATAVSIDNGKNIKVESITLKNEIIFYCDELPFEVMPLNRYLNIETMNIISFYDVDEIALFEIVHEEHYEETPKNYLFLAISLMEQNG